MKDLLKMPRGGLVLVGAVEYTGPSEALPPRESQLPFLGGFDGPQPRDPVGYLKNFCCSSSAIRSSADLAIGR